jgi:hypothetical protein
LYSIPQKDLIQVFSPEAWLLESPNPNNDNTCKYREVPMRKSEKVTEESERIINDIKRKILPSLINQKPRFVFRRKRIQSLFKEPIHRFLIDKDKIIFNVPVQETINFVASTNMPIFYLMDELSAIKNRATNRRLEHMRYVIKFGYEY